MITAVLAGQSQSEVARTYGVSQGWISRLMTRYRAEGAAAFEPLSRAPVFEPSSDPYGHRRTGAATAQAAHRGRADGGADTIGWHLTHHHATTLSRATINRILVRAGTVIPDPSKRPKSSYLRFEANQPNDMQYAMHHADPSTTLRYDMARANLDRHAAHTVAAYLAGMSVGKQRPPARAIRPYTLLTPGGELSLPAVPTSSAEIMNRQCRSGCAAWDEPFARVAGR